MVPVGAVERALGTREKFGVTSFVYIYISN
jgi:hypothetical protein